MFAAMQQALCGQQVVVTPESSPGTVITTVGPSINASPTPGTAGSGNILAITSGGQLSLGGTVISAYSGTSNVAELFYIDHTAWQKNTSNSWFGPITASSSGTAQSSPVPAVVLSNSTIAASSPLGAVIGTLSVITGLPNGASGTGAYTWSYGLSGTNASDFKVVGSSLETAVANLASGTYSLTVTAITSGVSGGPYSLPVTVTVAAPVTPTLALSGNTLPASPASGTVVGTLSVTNGSGSYTYALSGTNASDFQIVGNSLETAVANLAAGSYSVTVTATGTGGPIALPVTVTVSASGPTGSPITISSYFLYDNPVGNLTNAGSAFQPAGQPWYVANNAWGSPPANTQSCVYYAANLPNYTTFEWQNAGTGGNVLGYPELAIGNISGGVSFPPNGTTGTAVPSWYGATLSSLTHFIISWDIVINSTSGNPTFDILFEGYPGGTTSGGGGHETGLVCKAPLGWFSSGGVAFSNLGGISGYVIPNEWASGSMAIVPASVYGSPNTPLLSGTVDLMPIFTWAASKGYMSLSEPINGWEFGVEYCSGSGSVTFQGLSLEVS